MLHGLFIASFIGTCKQVIKEAFEPTIPAENWANKELIRKDRMNGISDKQFSKNLANGKYKLNKTHPEPHRGQNGKIVIENCALYHEDVKKYGAYQAQKWVEEGRYNLTKEELEKEHEKHKAKMEHLYKLL